MDYITVPELARETGIPERTVRRYLDRHKPFFTPRKEGGVYYISTEAVALMRSIRQSYDEGKSTAQINAELATSNVPMVIDVSDGQSYEVLPVAAVMEQQAAIMEILVTLSDELRVERAASQELRDELLAARSDMVAIRREVAAMREPSGRDRNREQAKAQADILRELKATREALEASEARQRKQEKRLDEVAEWTRPKPQEEHRSWLARLLGKQPR